ncbi:MAG TPA: enolase C-terminal domain-like protein [Wenzhouxiangellaceae bacterium]|nr:enolase C-terminal domain-like protein [Wenzhouxiangellaceae bacterium]
MNPSILQQPVTLKYLDLRRHRLRLAAPLKTAAGIFEVRETIVLRAGLQLPGGHIQEGFGEAAPLSGWTRETFPGMRSLAEEIEFPVCMRTVTDLDQHLPQLTASPVFRFGIELAILDALSRAADLPLGAALFQARSNRDPDACPLDAIPVQFTLGADRAEACIRALKKAADAGHTHAKLKVGLASCDADLARVGRIIEHCPRLTFRLDANAAWTPAQALFMLSSLPRDRVELIEQPVVDQDLPGLLDRYEGSGPHIAADESCAGLEQARALIRSGRLGAIVVKPSIVGGLLPAGRMFELARRHGVQVIISNLMESAVGRRAIAHLAAAWPELPGPHGLATGQWLADDLAPAADRIHRGKLVLDGTPGIGFQPGIAGPA